MTGAEKMRQIYHDTTKPKGPFEEWLKKMEEENCPSHFGLKDIFVHTKAYSCEKCWEKSLKTELGM